MKSLYVLDDELFNHQEINGSVLKYFKTKDRDKTYEVMLVISELGYVLLWGWFNEKQKKSRYMIYDSKKTALKQYSCIKNQYERR